MLRAFRSGVLALKIASLCVNREVLPLLALWTIAGLGSLSDNVPLNLGFGVVHVAQR
jgi:hypothetical protein